MLHLFLQCMGCEQPMLENINALCKICEHSLLTSPPLCNQCGSPICPTISDTSCTRPWIPRIYQERGGIHSYSARYLMLGQGYRVLKKWKLHRGPVFDRQVLVSNASLLANWKSLNVKAIIPIPQHFFRSWKMRGSPVEVIAQWVSAQTQLPIQRTLNMGTIQRSTKRQAQRNLGERLASRKNRFTINPSLKSLPSSVLLVDDFMTTGRTLNEAAQTLKNAGVQQIHAFCLGVRVFSSFRNFN